MNKDAFHAILPDLLEGAPDGCVVLQVKPDGADVGLVEDERRRELCGHWEAGLARDSNSVIGRSG